MGLSSVQNKLLCCCYCSMVNLDKFSFANDYINILITSKNDFYLSRERYSHLLFIIMLKELVSDPDSGFLTRPETR